MIEQKVKIVFNKRLASETFLMALASPEIVARASPGQFVMIRIRQGIDPLLRRPFSICATKSDDLFLILYKVVGRGTAILSQTQEGEILSVLGPLGKGFESPKCGSKHILVGGGMGVAPLIFLAQEIETGNLIFFAGFRSFSEIVPVDQIGLETVKTRVSTDDGTSGHQGPVTDLLEKRLTPLGKNKFMVYACGPVAMLRRVADLTLKRKIPCQVSLETAMACGMGACQGCAVKASTRENRTYFHVCQDGPVFDVKSLDWEML